MWGERVGEPTVLHVLEAVGGGTAKHLVDLVTHVDNVRHLVAVPSRRLGGLSDDAIVTRLRAAGAEVHVTPMRRRAPSKDNAFAAMRLRHLIRKSQPGLVHGHASVGGALARLAVAGTPTPLVWTPHAMLTGRCLTAAQRVLFRRAQTVIALSPSERDLIVRERVAGPEDVVVIPNGIESQHGTSAIDLRQKFNLAPTTPLVGSIARLVPQKSPLDFVRMAATVAAQHVDTHFVLVGDGPLASAVETEVARLDIGSRFHRHEQPQGAGQLLPQFDVFVSTSVFEGGPYTPLEAMAAEVPVVLTGCTGNRDAVDHGRSGLIVPLGDVDELASAVGLVLSDETLHARLRRGGREAVATRFDVQTMADRMSALYATVANAGAPVPVIPQPGIPVALEGLRSVAGANMRAVVADVPADA